MHQLKKQLIASNLSQFSKRQISVSPKVVVLLTLPWPSSKYQPKILEISPLYPPFGIFRISSYVFCTYILHSSRVARPPRKAFGGRKKKQHCLIYKRTNVNAPNVTNITCKNLSHLIYFNSDKKSHYTTKCFKPSKDRDTSKDG